MQFPKIDNPQLIKLATTYWQWRMLWIATTAVFATLALFYVLFLKGDTWVASQAIIVRDEANGAVMRLGRFQSQTEMKAAQETILEMARNAQVLQDALNSLGREPSWSSWMWGEKPPTTAEIDELARSGIQVRAPRGAELGTTEVIYLDVKQNSPSRAVKLNRAVCDALEHRMQQVRQVRADGVISELRTAKITAEEKLREATERLTRIETEAGADLSDLRGMTDANTGGSSNRLVLDTIKAELRQAELQLQQLQTDLQLATESFENPDQLLLTPSALFNSQTGLKTLRDGLSAATITTSQMLGKYTLSHPLVQTSLQAEANLREQLRNELGLAVQTLQKDRDIASQRVDKLNAQRLHLESRLEKLAHIRADYANVASDVRSRNLQLQESERELAQAQASRDAALTSSLITRLDEPLLGEKPIGPGRSTILAGATVSGLLFGLGLVFLISPLDSGLNYGRRRFDYSGLAGRRVSDRTAAASSATSPIPATSAVTSSDATTPASGAPGSERRRATADQLSEPMVKTFAMELPSWTQLAQATEKLTTLVESWRSSQRPLGPTSDSQVKRTVPILQPRPTAIGPTQSSSPAQTRPQAAPPAKGPESRPGTGLPLDVVASPFALQASMPPSVRSD